MFRRSLFVLCDALQKVPEAVSVTKDYRKLESQKKELAAAQKKREEFEKYPLRYQILECKPGMPLAVAKLKYLLACRRTHPEVGGDPESFLRVSLAYQDVMKDYGVETVDNQIVNLGNFQSDSSEVQNYLEARAQIKSYIPMATLEEHILKLEEVQRRLGGDLAAKLSANNDESTWLLEDIEDVMEQSGLKTVKLHVLEGGEIRPADTLSLTDGTERPIFLPEEDIPKSTTFEEQKDTENESDEKKCESTSDRSEAQQSPSGGQQSVASEDASGADKDSEQSDSKPIQQTVNVSRSDIEVLNAKHNLHERNDVAGLAARAATEVMNNTTEVRELRVEATVLFCVFVAVMFGVYAYVDAKTRYLKTKEARPEVAEHIQGDTMLPWWGNDAEYESQVKRIFVEEWRRARAVSQRTQTQQTGIARESLDEETKKKMDLEIFTVSADRLHEMRENTKKHPGRL